MGTSGAGRPERAAGAGVPPQATGAPDGQSEVKAFRSSVVA